MSELLTFLSAHGWAIAIGILAGGAITICCLAPPLMRSQQREDNAYLDGYEAGVAEAKAEANIAAFGRLPKEYLR